MFQSISLKEVIQKIQNRLILSFKDYHQNENTKLRSSGEEWQTSCDPATDPCLRNRTVCIFSTPATNRLLLP